MSRGSSRRPGIGLGGEMSSEEVLAQVRRTATAERLFHRGDRVVVGISGGPDSVGLLHLLQALRPVWALHLHLAHLDHGLRKASGRDAELVRCLGQRLSLPSTIERCDVGARCAREGWSLEDGARRVRYQFLLDVARRERATRVVLAHTADDQAETVLMRLIRGAGLLGLGAMPFARPLGGGIWVVRPLLEVWRTDLMTYLRKASIPYVDDPTNRDPRFLRNRIRHQLLPLLERDYHPNMKAALVQLAEVCRGDYAYLQQAADRWWKRLAKCQPATPSSPGIRRRDRGLRRQAAAADGRSQPSVVIALRAFLRQPTAIQRQVVRRAVECLQGDLTRFEYRHWVEVERLATGRPAGASVDLPGGIQFRRDDGWLVCRLVGPPRPGSGQVWQGLPLRHPSRPPPTASFCCAKAKQNGGGPGG